MAQAHHVIPTSWGGPDVSWNKKGLCPTTHANTHALLDRYVETNGDVPVAELRSYGLPERGMALLAWTAAQTRPDLYKPELTS